MRTKYSVAKRGWTGLFVCQLHLPLGDLMAHDDVRFRHSFAPYRVIACFLVLLETALESAALHDRALREAAPHLARRMAEEALRVGNEGLENRVQEQTAQLRTIIDSLHAEMAQRDKAERALRESEKLAATGRVAATIAHEINNPLEAVGNLIYLLETYPALDDTARDYVKVARQELDRVADITKQILSFYRGQSARVKVDVAQLVDEVLSALTHKFEAKNLSIHKRFEAAVMVQAFPGQIRQVVWNVIANAIEATAPGGRVAVRVFDSVDWRTMHRKGIRLVVADDGVGISRDYTQKIFEP